jgi:2-keto-4-pentenoate hydratase/2-oxohepta-3-ene-1,7-dioic acid hydratase in catechol pathway
MAPFAVTPDELGDAWRDGRVGLDLAIDWNGRRFGVANGREMDFGFHELAAHAARTRDLVAGTIIGSGTVSNASYREVGSSCISERRAIEMIADGAATTAFMSFGDTIRMGREQGADCRYLARLISALCGTLDEMGSPGQWAVHGQQPVHIADRDFCGHGLVI